MPFLEFFAIVPQDDAIAFVIGICGENVEDRAYGAPRPPSGAYAHASGGARLALARSSVIRAALRPRTPLLVLRAASSARPFCFC